MIVAHSTYTCPRCGGDYIVPAPHVLNCIDCQHSWSRPQAPPFVSSTDFASYHVHDEHGAIVRTVDDYHTACEIAESLQVQSRAPADGDDDDDDAHKAQPHMTPAYASGSFQKG